MNAAIRAIVRMSLYRECEPYAVLEGFRGLVEGRIVPFTWNDVAHIISEGGTAIKSSRCPEFMETKWRKVAAGNLVRLGIDRLIVIGGDGSLTGADIFRQEWSGLLAELVAEGAIDKNAAIKHEHLMIVGLVGSIDNDMVGTEITIGANSSLHRIIEAIDCIHSTASSHQRAFVIEVMGRHCGWLALNAAISCAADWLLIPEDPPGEGWEKRMGASIARHRALGRSVSIVIVAEGAVDRQNHPIRSDYVRQVLQENGLDARVTTLGHIQRGGNPSAYDRYLGTMQGIKAVEAVLDADPARTTSLLVGMNENRMTIRPLMECVRKTRAISAAMGRLTFEEAFNLRDPDFCANYAMWQLMHRAVDSSTSASASSVLVPPDRDEEHILRGLRVGILNCGAPCGGMNAAVAAAFFYNMAKGFTSIGIFNGFDGLIQGDARELIRSDMFGMVGKGGSMLGTNRVLPSTNISCVAEQIEKLELDALLIVGGFEAYTALLQLSKARTEYPSLCLPLVVIPATISNNVPGTEYSIGSDTALNVIVQSCDYIRQSASSSRKRVFVVDVHGGYCGYLATLAGMATGASRVYIHEEGLHLADLKRDAQHLKHRFLDDRRQGRLVLRNEYVSKVYSAELISKILEEEGGESYDSRYVVLGHLQQGGSPSPLDRIRAVRLAVLSMNYVESLLLPDCERLAQTFEKMSAGVPSPIHIKANSDESDAASSVGEEGDGRDAVVIGIRGPHVRFTPAAHLESSTDMKLRRPREQWWMSLRRYSRILSKYSDPNDL
jgi:6-phosphofructokinase 1